MYFKETTMAEQCIKEIAITIYFNNNGWTIYLKKQWLNNVLKQQWLNNVCFKETTMAEKYILKKQQWLNNIF